MNIVLQNLMIGISLAAPLGPATLAIIRTGFQRGFWPAFQVALGVVAADTTYVLLVYFGLSSFVTIPLVKTLLFLFGFLVLAYLGYVSIKEATKNVDLQAPAAKPDRNMFSIGYAVNISNPIAIVWWLGVFGSVLASTQAASRLGALLSSLTIVAGILIWHTGLSISSHYGNKYLNKRVLKWVSILGGLALIGFAIRFGYNAVLSIR